MKNQNQLKNTRKTKEQIIKIIIHYPENKEDFQKSYDNFIISALRESVNLRKI